MIKDFEYEELPSYIKKDIPEEDFLAAYATSEKSSSNIIVWAINRALNRQVEFEYNPSTNSTLSISERASRTPKPLTVQLDNKGFELRKSCFFEHETNTLHDQYTLIDSDRMQEVEIETETHYSPTKRELSEIADALIKKYKFPEQYAQWNHAQRVNYWTERLYRMRRQAGESGAHEDCAFDKTLAQQMKNIDSDIEKILPDCIMKLSQLEQVDHAALLAAFRARTGLLI